MADGKWKCEASGSIVPLSFSIHNTGRAPGGYTVYKLSYEVKVTLPHGELVYHTYELWKRYTEFQQLYKQLDEAHRAARSPDQMPRLLKAGYLDRFKESVIEERKASATEVLRFATTQPHLDSFLTAFTEGAVKLSSSPYQRTPVQPTSMYIEKPVDSVPLSAMMEQTTPTPKQGELPTVTGKTPTSTGADFSKKEKECSSDSSEQHEPDNTGGFPEQQGEFLSNKGESPESSDSEPDLTINAMSSSPPVPSSGVSDSNLPVSGASDSWWTDAVAVTDGLDNLLDGLDNSKLSEVKGSPGLARKESDYIRQAGKLISSALSSESNGDYSEAFSLLKAGVDLLLNGVQNDSSKRRREIVSQKTAQYLQHAESLHQRHLAPPPMAKPHLLPDFRVVEVFDKVMVVESRMTGQRFVIKTLHKSLSARARSSTNRAPGLCRHMVRLLHHYETSNQRIFLLLEYHRRGRLVDHVISKRNQWKRLSEAALNPHPSSRLISKENDDMERMLSELTSIAPPSSTLPHPDTTDTTDPNTDTTDSNADISDSNADISDSNDPGEDSLDDLRRRLEEAVSVRVEPPTPTAEETPVLPAERKSPAYSPASRGSPEPAAKADEWVLRLEEQVRGWAAQVILGLEHLHNQGIIVRDLHPGNILLADSGRAVLTYFGKWDFVERRSRRHLDMYVAPEGAGLAEPTPSCDWWSLGAILFELLTGQSVLACHPDGVSTHLPLRLPVALSPEATGLLTQLLQADPRERLGSGVTGVEELKSHSFFTGINWHLV